MCNPSTCDCESNKACKIDKFLDTKNCSCKKRLISKLVLECEDEILNTTGSSPDNKKGTCKKTKILLAIMCLLLIVVISIGCYYYYTRDWIKKELVLSL